MKWKWGIERSPAPEFRIRSWHLRGLKDATPQAEFRRAAALPRQTVYFRGIRIRDPQNGRSITLPFPAQPEAPGGNQLLSRRWTGSCSAKQLVTATFHAAPQRLGFVNMDYFNPEETTPDASTHNYTGTLSDHLTIFGGLLETTRRSRASMLRFGQGNQDLTITPTGNSGNYFAQKARTATRQSAAFHLCVCADQRCGHAQFQDRGPTRGGIGETPRFNIIRSTSRTRRSTDTSNQLYAPPRSRNRRSRVCVFRPGPLDPVTPRLAVDLGVRTESQQVSGGISRGAANGDSPGTSCPGRDHAACGLWTLLRACPAERVLVQSLSRTRCITTYDTRRARSSLGPDGLSQHAGANTRAVAVRFPTPDRAAIFPPHSANWSMEVGSAA